MATAMAMVSRHPQENSSTVPFITNHKNNNFRTFTIYIMMLNLGNFIADNVTHRAESMFAADIENNRETLS